MPLWIYEIQPFFVGLIMFFGFELISLGSLALVRKWVHRHIRFHDGVNDAVSGTVQTIGVFYGITVGLIAVGVWNTFQGASDTVSREAAAIGAMYQDVCSLPDPIRTQLQSLLRDYTIAVIGDDWPAQERGGLGTKSPAILNRFRQTLLAYEPSGAGANDRYSESLRAYNFMSQQRLLRVDAVQAGLSQIMWQIIWAGAVISLTVTFFFHLEDPKLHAILVGLTAAFLAVVIFTIVVNDKPFYGTITVTSDSYKLVLDTVLR